MSKNQTDWATARPWELDGFNDSGVWRVKSGKRIVAYLYPQMPKSDDEINADAALIVRAVNAYDLTKSVLKAIQARIDGVWDNPELVSFGPLSTDTLQDVKELVEVAFHETNKGKSTLQKLRNQTKE